MDLDQVPVKVGIMMICCALFYTRVIIFKKSLELELNKVFE
jgi:K+-sensing histidine kinase KdpD